MPFNACGQRLPQAVRWNTGLGRSSSWCEDCIVSVRLRDQHLFQEYARLKVRDGLAAVHDLGGARKTTCNDGLEVVDLDLYGGADLALCKRWVECGSHSGIGQCVNHCTMDDLMRIEVVLRHDEAEFADAGALLVDSQVNQFGEGIGHSF